MLQTELTKRIEAMLEAEDVRSDQYREAPRTRVSFRSTPVFMSADDYDPAMPEVSEVVGALRDGSNCTCGTEDLQHVAIEWGERCQRHGEIDLRRITCDKNQA